MSSARPVLVDRKRLELVIAARSGAEVVVYRHGLPVSGGDGDGGGGGAVISVAGRAGAVVLAKSDVGLGNVDNTADANKPVSTAQAGAIALKLDAAAVSAFGLTLIDDASATAARGTLGLGSAAVEAAAAFAPAAHGHVIADITNLQASLDGKQASIAAGTIAQYWRGDKSWQTLDKTAVGLGSVDNTSDADKPVSTAQATALALKAPLASPALTGAPSAPTASAGTNSTQIASTAFVQAAIAALIGGALPSTLDTLDELAAALGDDPNFAATIATSLAGKQPLDATLTALAGLAGGADKLAYFTGTDVLAQADLTSFGRTLIALASYAALRAGLNVADGATANDSDANLKNRANHTGTQAIGTIAAAATARLFGRATAGTGAGEELTKAQVLTLLNVADGATANDSDVNLKARANHTGSQAASTISDLVEAVQDIIGAMFVAAGGTYNDPAGTITLPGGGADPLTLTNTPTMPNSGDISLGERSLAGLSLPAYSSEFGERQLQALLGRARVLGFNVHGAQVQGFGGAWTGNISTLGTVNTATISPTNRLTREARGSYTSAATAGSLCGVNHSSSGSLRPVMMSDGSGKTGFLHIYRLGVSDPAAVSGARMFVGLSTQNSTAPTNVEPSTLVNHIGVGQISSSNNLHIIFGGSSPQAPIDLGSDFPANTLGVDLYEVIFFSAPGSQDLKYRVERNPDWPTNNFVTSGTITNTTPGTTLPAASSIMTPLRVWRTNNATALAVGIDFIGYVVHLG